MCFGIGRDITSVAEINRSAPAAYDSTGSVATTVFEVDAWKLNPAKSITTSAAAIRRSQFSSVGFAIASSASGSIQLWRMRSLPSSSRSVDKKMARWSTTRSPETSSVVTKSAESNSTTFCAPRTRTFALGSCVPSGCCNSRSNFARTR